MITFPESHADCVITAAAGTLLKMGDTTAAMFDIPLGTRVNLVVDLGAGDDELTLENVSLDGKVDIMGGAGNNTVNLSGLMEEEGIFYYTGGDQDDTITGNLTSFAAGGVSLDLKGGANDVAIESLEFRVLHDFKTRGGGGADSVALTGRSGHFGSLTVDLGGGLNSTQLGLEEITFSFGVKVNGGADSDTFSLAASKNLSIRKGLTLVLGDGLADVEVAAGLALSIGGPVNGAFGKSAAGQSSVRFGGSSVVLGPLGIAFDLNGQFGGYFLIAGYDAGTGITDTNPAGTIAIAGAMKLNGVQDVALYASNAIAVTGAAGIYSNALGGGLLGVTSLSAPFMHFGAGLSYTSTGGTCETQIIGDTIQVAGKLSLAYNLGDTATHEITLGVPGGSLSAGSVAIAHKSGALNLSMAGAVNVAGAFAIVDGAGATTMGYEDVKFDFGAAALFDFGAGAATVTMSGSSFTADGAVTFKSTATGADVDAVALDFETFRAASLKVQGGAGGSVFTLDALSGRIENAALNLGTGGNLARLSSPDVGGLVIPKLTYLSNSGSAALVDRLTLEGVAAKAAALVMGDAASRIAIVNARFGALGIGTRGGADIVGIDDTLVIGATLIDTGTAVENDETHIESDTAAGGASYFGGKFTANLGNGDDLLTVATVAATTKANFFGAVLVNGGDGTDTFTPHATNAVFAVAPVLTSIP